MASTKVSKNEEDKKKKKKGKEATHIAKSPHKKTAKQEKEKKKKKKSNNTANGTRSESPDVVEIQLSSCDSQEAEDETEEEEIENRSEPKNRSSKSRNNKTNKSNKRKEKAAEDDSEGEDGTLYRLPMARIKRIIKSEDPSLQLNQDVVFLVNKATEKFIEQFCEDAYDCSVRDRKKSLRYKHLSSVVSEQRRFDFLSDFVPEKLKAVDALAQRKSLETRQG